MENSPLPHQLDSRLKQLNQEIRSCLKDVRQRIKELEQAEQGSRSSTAAGPGQRFDDVFRQAVEDRDSPQQKS